MHRFFWASPRSKLVFWFRCFVARGSKKSQRGKQMMRSAQAANKRKNVQEAPKAQKRRKVTRTAQKWLLKSEPEDLPFSAVKEAPNQTATFNGVRSVLLAG
jgi:hypothetical protein